MLYKMVFHFLKLPFNEQLSNRIVLDMKVEVMYSIA